MTTAPAETMLPSPIVTPGWMIALRPIHTLSMIRTGLTSSADGGRPARRASGSAGCPLTSKIATPLAIRQSRADRDLATDDEAHAVVDAGCDLRPVASDGRM